MPALSEANYLSRRVKLQQNLRAATRAYEDVCFKHELETATDEEVATARAVMLDLDGRLSGLDAAWNRVVVEAAQQDVDANTAAREAAVAKIDKLLAKRLSDAKAIEQAATALAAAYRAFTDTGREIVDTAAPHHRHVLGDLDHFRHAVTGDFGSPAFLIAGHLKVHGLDFGGINPDEAAWRVRERGIVSFVEQMNVDLRRRASTIAPNREAEAA